MQPKKLVFGPAGIPLSTVDRNTQNGIARVKELGLGAMELEFVQSVFLKEPAAIEVNAVAKQHDIWLTCHGSYFINLNADEKVKQDASIKRILDAARILSIAGGYSMTFHAAYYLKSTPEQTYQSVKTHFKHIIKTLQNEGHKIWVRPETTGKGTQFGTVDEILKLSQEVEQVMPCIDFSHLYARSIGQVHKKEQFQEVMQKVEKALGKEGLNNMHIHMSGIAYGLKGEKNHLLFKDSEFPYKTVLEVLKEFNAKGVVICESPDLEGDAMVLQKTFGVL
jgi:deoxyribonuclease IV